MASYLPASTAACTLMNTDAYIIPCRTKVQSRAGKTRPTSSRDVASATRPELVRLPFPANDTVPQQRSVFNCLIAEQK